MKLLIHFRTLTVKPLKFGNMNTVINDIGSRLSKLNMLTTSKTPLLSEYGMYLIGSMDNAYKGMEVLHDQSCLKTGQYMGTGI